MSALRDIQQAFAEGVLSGRFDSMAEHLHVPGSTPARRLGIYRNNTLSNLRGALRQVYPIVYQLVGDEFFNQAARQFIAEYPSSSGDLNDYGGDFAQFLVGYEPAVELDYLSDVARLEWALEQAYYAPDHEPLALSRLGTVSPEHYIDLRLKLYPAITLMQSDYPLQEIWRVHQPDYEGDGTVDLSAGAEWLLITRRAMQCMIEPITQVEYIFLRCLQEGNSFIEAVTAALANDESYPLQERLATLVTQGDIVDFDVTADDR